MWYDKYDSIKLRIMSVILYLFCPNTEDTKDHYQ